jgi:hypothetical protein
VGHTSAAKTVTVTNNQVGAISLSASISGANSADFAKTGAGTTCTANLAGKGNCAYGVTFKPSAKGGRNATLTISASPDSVSSHALALSGQGK